MRGYNDNNQTMGDDAVFTGVPYIDDLFPSKVKMDTLPAGTRVQPEMGFTDPGAMPAPVVMPSQSSTLFGLPMWAVLLAGGALAWYLLKKGKR